MADAPAVRPIPYEPRRDPRRKGWAVWNVKRSACCGRARVHVFPNEILEIQCECGKWLPVPILQRVMDRADE